MAVHVAGERLLAAVHDLDRAARVEGEHRAVDLHGEVLTAAERAADPGEMDAHLLGRKVEAGRHLVAIDVQPLRRHVDVHAALAVGHRQPRLRAEKGLVLDADLVEALDAHLALRDRVAVADGHGADHVRPGVVHVAVAVRRRIRVERRLLGRALRVDDELERLVRDGDLLGGAARLLRVLGRDERDGLAEVPHAVDRQHRLVGKLEPVLLVARHVLVCEDSVDTGHRHGCRDVDPRDARVCMRTAHGVAPEHAGRGEIARVRELARRLRNPVDARGALADAAELELSPGGGAHVPAAMRTASRIFW